MQVHDEVLVEATAEELDTVVDLTRTTLSGAATLSVPLEVNLSVGRSWAAAKS